MDVVVGDTDCVPEVVLVPVHAPDAVHEVAVVDDHVRVEDKPDVIEVGDAESVTVGAEVTALFTVTLTDVVVFVFPTASRALAVNV